jgi:hypothetical protein
MYDESRHWRTAHPVLLFTQARRHPTKQIWRSTRDIDDQVGVVRRKGAMLMMSRFDNPHRVILICLALAIRAPSRPRRVANFFRRLCRFSP